MFYPRASTSAQKRTALIIRLAKLDEFKFEMSGFLDKQRLGNNVESNDLENLNSKINFIINLE